MPRGFRLCADCHARSPQQIGAVGPYLGGIFGRKAGTQPGFEYSAALASSGLTWTEDNLRAFMDDPQTLVPGSRKRIPVRNPAVIVGIVDYLKTLK